MNEKEAIMATSLKLPTGSIAVFAADCIVAAIAAFLWYVGWNIKASWLYMLMTPVVLLPVVSLCFVVFRHYGFALASNCFHVLCVAAIMYGFWMIFHHPIPHPPVPSDEGLIIIINISGRIAGRAVLFVLFSIMEVMLLIITLFTIPITFSAVVTQKKQTAENISKETLLTKTATPNVPEDARFKDWEIRMMPERGDYTEERETLLKDVSVDGIAESIAERKHRLS